MRDNDPYEIEDEYEDDEDLSYWDYLINADPDEQEEVENIKKDLLE